MKSKNSFWLRTGAVFFGLPFLIIIILSLLIVGIIFSIKNISIYWEIFVLGLICLLFMVYVLFIDKNTLTKIVFSEQGIRCFWLNKEIKNIKWTDVVEVKAKANGWAAPFLSFVVLNHQDIDLELNKKHYDAIMLICPNEGIKAKINNLECFKCYSRKK